MLNYLSENGIFFGAGCKSPLTVKSATRIFAADSVSAKIVMNNLHNSETNSKVMQQLLVKAVSKVWMGKERVCRFIGPLSLQGAFFKMVHQILISQFNQRRPLSIFNITRINAQKRGKRNGKLMEDSN